MEKTTEGHYSVLLRESIDALVMNPDGIYIDGTFGRGGHSREILAALSDKGRLIAFDKDPQAIGEGTRLAQLDQRFAIAHSSFAGLKKVLMAEGAAGKVDGILLDLGVSSPQLDNAGRGFSFLQDGPLDMRMDNSAGRTAADWINTADEKDIAFVLREYGEERFAKRMARAVVERRQILPITTTREFANIISEANPRWEKGKHPATRAFQAVRIFINAELDDLKKVLVDAVDVLADQGRLVVISFHSLEDRIVKRFFRDQSRGREFPPGLPVTEQMLMKKLRTVGKAVKAGPDEIENNIRSRSAIMRIAERIS